MSDPIHVFFSDSQVVELVRRMNLLPKLIRRQQEELIIDEVPVPKDWLDEQRQVFLGDKSIDQLLQERCWEKADLDRHLLRPEALRRFATQHFGPGLEETFLSSSGKRDLVIYSLLRVRDAGLARELWIRIEEGETTFAEAAQKHGVGEEAQRKGVIGPIPIGTIQPEILQEILRALRPGELSAPRQLGEWHVLMRLEQLNPARFDGDTREQMQQEALNAFLEERVKRVLSGQADALEPIHYDPET